MILLYVYIILNILFLPKISSFELTEHQKSVQNFNKIQTAITEVIDYNIERNFLPQTVRLVLYESREEEFNWDFVRNYVVLIGDVKPVVPSPEPRSISTEKIGYEPMFRYTVLIFITDRSKVTALLEKIKRTMNRRWDRLIIIGHEQVISQIMRDDRVIEFKDKCALPYDTGNIWTEPLDYRNGEMEIVRNVREFPERKSMGGTLRGRHFKVAINEFKPLVYEIGKDSNGTTIVSGIGVNLIESGAKAFNYTFEPVYNPIWWGGIDENGTWIGVLGMVHHEKFGCHIIPIAGHHIIWSYAFEFTSVCGTIDKIFFTGQPRAIIEWYAFVLPFSWQVWVWTIITYFFLNFVLLGVMYFVHHRKFKRIVLESGFFLPYALAMEQGLTDIPPGSRYIAVVWLLGTVILGTGYKSTLRTNLMMPIPEIPPATFDQLAERLEYEVLVYKATDMDVIGQSLPKTVAERMKIEKDMDKFFKYAYTNYRTAALSWNPMITTEILTRIPGKSFIYSQDAFNRLPYSTLFQKHSIFVDSYNGITAALFETGIFSKWEKMENYKFQQIGYANIKNNDSIALMYERLAKQQEADFDFESKPLTVWNFRVMFVILFSGCLIGTGVFMAEYYFTHPRTAKHISEISKSNSNINRKGPTAKCMDVDTERSRCNQGA